MQDTRLTLALESGLKPDGLVHVMSPPAGYDLSALPRVSVEATFRPDYIYYERLGLIGSGDGRAATLVIMPRSKARGRQMLAEAGQAGGIIIVDGQKTDGIDSIYNEIRKTCPIGGVITKSHGRLFWCPAGGFPDWRGDHRSPEGYVTVPGVFSEKKIDPASALLSAYIRDLKGRVCDLGAGWGYLSREILRSNNVTQLDMVEAEKRALDCAVQNARDPRARPMWADATDHTGGPYDAVVSNPPFHSGREGNPDLGRAFIRAAHRNLAPQGQFLMVANRHLPYEAELDALFSHVESLEGTGAFKLFRARRPRR